MQQLLLLALIITRSAHANLASVRPSILPTDGTKLQLTGDSNGGLLAGSAWAGQSRLPPNKTLCCDFTGCSSAIGGESKGTLVSATSGSCVVPPFTATGEAQVQLFLSDSPDCHHSTACKGGGCARTCVGGLAGKVHVQVQAKTSVLAWAVGRRPYVQEQSGALVVKAASVEDIAPWLPAGEASVDVQLQISASLMLPGGAKILFARPYTLLVGHAASLPFDFTGIPDQLSAMITTFVTVISHRTGHVLMKTNSTRLFQRFMPPSTGPPGGVIQLDRHRRALLVDGDVWQGFGWYTGAGKFTGNFTATIDRMSLEGYNLIMTYGFLKDVPPASATPADLEAFLAHCESVGVHVIYNIMWLIEGYSYCAAKNGSGCNLTATETAITQMAEVGARSRSLLGWYVCDDCKQPQKPPHPPPSSLPGCCTDSEGA